MECELVNIVFRVETSRNRSNPRVNHVSRAIDAQGVRNIESTKARILIESTVINITGLFCSETGRCAFCSLKSRSYPTFRVKKNTYAEIEMTDEYK